jgi:hypothetical protein
MTQTTERADSPPSHLRVNAREIAVRPRTAHQADGKVTQVLTSPGGSLELEGVQLPDGRTAVIRVRGDGRTIFTYAVPELAPNRFDVTATGNASLTGDVLSIAPASTTFGVTNADRVSISGRLPGRAAAHGTDSASVVRVNASSSKTTQLRLEETLADGTVSRATMLGRSIALWLNATGSGFRANGAANFARTDAEGASIALTADDLTYSESDSRATASGNALLKQRTAAGRTLTLAGATITIAMTPADATPGLGASAPVTEPPARVITASGSARLDMERAKIAGDDITLDFRFTTGADGKQRIATVDGVATGKASSFVFEWEGQQLFKGVSRAEFTLRPAADSRWSVDWIFRGKGISGRLPNAGP